MTRLFGALALLGAATVIAPANSQEYSPHGSCPANEWNGGFGTATTAADCAQPSFGNLSGTASPSQLTYTPFARINIQVLAASAIYTPSMHLLYARIRGAGSGGGGGGGSSQSGGQAGGGGGGAGEAGDGRYNASTIGSSCTVTIGAAGLGGATGSSSAGISGGAGGTSTFVCGSTTLMSLAGGAGGGGGNVGGAQPGGDGGTSSLTNEAYKTPGGDGGVGSIGANSFGGMGGGSRYGTGGAAGSGGAAPRAGQAPGTGGGGGWLTQNGAAGASGIFVVTEYLSQ